MPSRKLLIVLYTRTGCHLCDEAEELLRMVIGPERMELTKIDVDADTGLSAQFGEWVPVIAIDGVIRFRGRISPALLRRLL
jgi:glutaredoxin